MKTYTEQELRELDAWIAWHVMKSTTSLVKIQDPDISFFPHYSTDPAAAMQVLEKCVDKLQSFDICIWKGVTGGLFFCGERKGGVYITSFVKAETLPLAICLFAKQLFSK